MKQKLNGQVEAKNVNLGHSAKHETIELLTQTVVNLVGLATAVLFARVFVIAVGLGLLWGGGNHYVMQLKLE